MRIWINRGKYCGKWVHSRRGATLAAPSGPARGLYHKNIIWSFIYVCTMVVVAFVSRWLGRPQATSKMQKAIIDRIVSWIETVLDPVLEYLEYCSTLVLEYSSTRELENSSTRVQYVHGVMTLYSTRVLEYSSTRVGKEMPWLCERTVIIILIIFLW